MRLSPEQAAGHAERRRLECHARRARFVAGRIGGRQESGTACGVSLNAQKKGYTIFFFVQA